MSETPNSNTAAQFIDELFAIQREDPFRDPTFDAVRSGAMSRTGVLQWALQASLVVRQFTRFISAIHANCPDRAAQQLLAENLWEEHGRGVSGRDHYELIRKLARSLGATDHDLDDTRPLPETTDYINHCLKVTRELPFVESMTAISLGIEYFMPAFFAVLGESLSTKYGLETDALDYLMIHVSEDETHSRRALTLLEEHADTPESREKAKDALREMLKVKRRFALAVYDRCSSIE